MNSYCACVDKEQMILNKKFIKYQIILNKKMHINNLYLCNNIFVYYIINYNIIITFNKTIFIIIFIYIIHYKLTT